MFFETQINTDYRRLNLNFAIICVLYKVGLLCFYNILYYRMKQVSIF